jgi:flagellar motor switch protein FliN/FliY
MSYDDLNERFQAVAEKFLTTVSEVGAQVLTDRITIHLGECHPLTEDLVAGLELPQVMISFESTTEANYTHTFSMASSLAGQLYQWMGAGEPPEAIGDEHLDAIQEMTTQIIGQVKSSLADEIAFEIDHVQVSLASSADDLKLPSEALFATITFSRGEEEQQYPVTYVLSGGPALEAEETEPTDEAEAAEEPEVAEASEAPEGAVEAMEEEAGEGAAEAATTEAATDESEVETEGLTEEGTEAAQGETETKEAESEEGLPDLSGLFDTELSPDEETGLVEISSAEFEEFDKVEGTNGRSRKIDMLLDVELDVTVELGRKLMSIDDILRLGKGSVVELEKLAGEPVDILVNGKKLAEGEVVVVEDHFGVRLTHLLNPKERIKSLGG